MNSSMIGKIEKAHRYAKEPDRFRISQITGTFHGGHDDYVITLDNGHWRCTCHTFETHAVGDETCAHVMAMQDLLKPMLPEDARFLNPNEKD